MEPEIIVLFAVGWLVTLACFLLVYFVTSRFEHESLKYYSLSLQALERIEKRLSGEEHPALRAISDAAVLIQETAKRLEALRKGLGS